MNNSEERRKRTEILFQELSPARVFRIQGVRARWEHENYLQHSLSLVPNICERFRRKRKAYDKEFWGALGCTLSHLKAISQLFATNLSYALIVEDDAVTDTAPYWTFSIAEFAASLPHDWTFAQLSLTGDSNVWFDAFSKWQTSGRNFMANNDFWGTVAYLISRKGMEDIVNLYGYEKFDLRQLRCINADLHLLKSAVPKGTFYIATPPMLTFTDDSISQVHDSSQLSTLGAPPENDRARVHLLSRHFALEWNAIKWRGKKLSEETSPSVSLTSKEVLPFGRG